jgi:putative glutamine amidotransferase
MHPVRIALTLGHEASKSERNDYIRALLDAGLGRDEIVVLPPGSEPEGSFDGVVLGGGLDVHPARYGREVLADGSVELDQDRDTTDFAVFELARQKSLPILGICRGMQVVNVALGGTLVQDIPTQRPSEIEHLVPEKQDDRRDHMVVIKPGSHLFRIASVGQIEVNSRHHQGVDRPAPGLRVSALAPDGLVEAIESDGPWLVAVQWHPENLLEDPFSRRLFADFARAAREHAGEGISWPPDLLTPA